MPLEFYKIKTVPLPSHFPSILFLFHLLPSFSHHLPGVKPERELAGKVNEPNLERGADPGVGLLQAEPPPIARSIRRDWQIQRWARPTNPVVAVSDDSGVGRNRRKPRLRVESDRRRDPLLPRRCSTSAPALASRSVSTSRRPLSLTAVFSLLSSSAGLSKCLLAACRKRQDTSPPSLSLRRHRQACSRHAVPDPPTLAPPPKLSKLAAAMDGWTTAGGIAATAPARDLACLGLAADYSELASLALGRNARKEPPLP
uniref:Uncharacterized protein n=1 Tax=Oryza nivara TaxID=4536 RepID=A0A0E0G3T4_ORYNI